MITTSIVLDTDLACPGIGLLVPEGSRNLTIDLNGHTIAGSGIPESTGIAVDGGIVKVINGIVQEFGTGIGNNRIACAQIARVVIQNNVGVGADHPAGCMTINNSVIRGNGIGAVSNFQSAPLEITDSQVYANAADGITVTGDATVSRSRVYRNGGNGMQVLSGVSGLTVSDSSVSDNGRDGVYTELRPTPHRSGQHPGR